MEIFEVKFKTKFKVKDHVFRKCDEHKNLYIVVAYLIDAQGVMYKVTGVDGSYFCYDFEIDDYSKRLAIIN